MNVKYINPFLTAIVDIFKEKISLDAKPSKPFIKKDKKGSGVVTGIIGVSGDFKASFSITFEKEVIKYIFQKLFNKEIVEITDEIRDEFGKLLNEICQKAKKIYEDEGISVNFAIPSILTGEGHKIQHIENIPVIALTFNTTVGKFNVEFAVAE